MRKILSALLSIMLMFSLILPLGTVYGADTQSVAAFPEAEGGGKFSPGARGVLQNGGEIEVYHVTNLNPSGSGSFADAISKEGRIIVFDVGGTIKLTEGLRIKKNNLTILGQTAPGDGITLIGGDLIADDNVKNIIMRYIRVRPTDINGGEPDGIGGRFNENVIIDHCSASWCVDELLTLYAGAREDVKNGGILGNHLTLQDSIGAESLRMSNHIKGAHGYGAIWGGQTATYVRNLLAHHDSRSPRMDRQLEGTDVNNNVIYDWGQTNSAYGGEPFGATDKTSKIPCRINWIGNYYKYGPGTRQSLKSRIYDVTSPQSAGDPKSKFFFSGNYMWNNTSVTNNNVLGVNNSGGAELLTTEVDMGEYSYGQMTAEEAYNYVLSNAGATLPRRDAVDARIVNDVKNGTGRLVNNADEVGGLIPNDEEYRVFKISDEWLVNNSLSGKDETEIIASGKWAGYTVIEAYVNDWTAEQSKIPPTNPNIIVQSPSIGSLSNKIDDKTVENGEWSVITEGESVNYKASAIAVGGNEVTKMELYDGNEKIKEYSAHEINENIVLNAGVHYLTCRAHNTRGEKTQSTTAIVYVKSSEASGSFKYTEINKSSYKGKGGASMDEKGVYTIYGSGRIAATKSNDECDFMYKEVSGDFDISTRIEEIPKFENQQVSGLMVRSGLEKNAVMAMIGDGWVKNGENARVITRKASGSEASEVYFKDKNGADCDNSKTAYEMPKYMRIQRSGDTLTFSVSNSGGDWTDNNRQPLEIKYDNLPDKMYIGIATDSAKGVSTKECFSVAKFSKLTVNGETDVEVDELSIPFHDADFSSSAWYIPSCEERDCSANPVGGNSGKILLYWGEIYRNFRPQKRGVVTVSADFYMLGGKSQVDSKTGSRFMLKGIDGSGKTVKIANIYAQHEYGFFTEYDSDDAIPNTSPVSQNKPEYKTWYNVTASLDYFTGKGQFTFTPYTNYDSRSNVYTLGETMFEYSFDFDTSIAVNMFNCQRLGGWEMYISNVSGDVQSAEYLIVENDNVTVNRPEQDAMLLIAEYSGEKLAKCSAHSVSAGTSEKFTLPDTQNKVKLYLWNKNYAPLCDALELQN